MMIPMVSNAAVVVALSLRLYLETLRFLRKKAWAASISIHERPLPPKKGGRSHLLADIRDQCVIPTFGGISGAESLYMVLNQYPLYAFALVKLVVSLPVYLSRMLLAKLEHGSFSKHTQEDIVNLILCTPGVYMLCKPLKSSSQDDLLEFTLPKDLPGESSCGTFAHGDVSIVFDHRERCIIRATYRGKELDIRKSCNLLFSLVIAVGNNWSHFKSHLMAEVSAQEIIGGRTEALEPSARFVLGLHSGLLNSPLSPAVPGSPLFAISTSRRAFEERMRTKMPHYIDRSKFYFPGFQFCFAARKSIAKHLQDHDLQVNVEPLFQNMIVHSVDHILVHRHLHMRPFSIDGSESIVSYIRSHLWISFWTPPKVNLLDDGRLCSIVKESETHQFYRDVYNDIKEVDSDLAARIMVSTSF